MKNLKSLSVLIFGMALMFIACSKGNTGPAGPAGPTGPGSVTYSSWITLGMTRNTTSAGDTFYTQTLVTPALTQQIIDSGIILTYVSFKDNSNNTNVLSATPYFTVIIYYTDSIYLEAPIDLTGIFFRYVLVPGSVSAGSITSGPAKGMTVAQLQTMSYATIRKLLGQQTAGEAIKNN
jgi:hypothetical protein